MVCSLQEKSEIRVVKVSHHYMRVERTYKTIQQTVLFCFSVTTPPGWHQFGTAICRAARHAGPAIHAQPATLARLGSLGGGGGATPQCWMPSQVRTRPDHMYSQPSKRVRSIAPSHTRLRRAKGTLTLTLTHVSLYGCLNLHSV